MNWKVDRVLTNQRLNLIAGTEITSNVPKAWFLALVENRQEGKGNGILTSDGVTYPLPKAFSFKSCLLSLDLAGLWAISLFSRGFSLDIPEHFFFLAVSLHSHIKELLIVGEPLQRSIRKAQTNEILFERKVLILRSVELGLRILMFLQILSYIEFSFPLVSGPLSSHEVDGVRKEKERLTASLQQWVGH